ncbi:hypothetical protein A2U01_0056494, partial [Trifolium medium]|nr:hypothetical protein [Trifolium medium]
RSSRLINYSSHAALLVLFGHWFVRGLALHRWTPFLFAIISFSLLTQQVALEHAVLLCNSYGLLVCGCCGLKEITDCSEAQEAPCVK